MLDILLGVLLVLLTILAVCVVVVLVIMGINCALELLDDTMSLWDDLTGWFTDEEG